MAYGDGRYWITYNGELYNFRALRAELEADGFDFATDCDTEVLLAMYARHGERMLERLNGIFAFAIWDTERDELFLARDRLGVKPLYYAQHDGVLYFASEIKALLRRSRGPRFATALAEYLTFLWVPEPETLFEGICKLPAGHCARYADGRLEIRQYWDMSFAPGDCTREEQWVRRMRAEVASSVAGRWSPTCPSAASSAAGSTRARSSTRCAGPPTRSPPHGRLREEDLAHEIVPDDLGYARRVAAELGVDNHERVLEPGVVDLLPKLVWHLDEPIADPAAITTYLICSAARERLTVILSGMGGDEIFAGYPRHLAARLTRPLDLLPVRARRALRSALDGRLTWARPGGCAAAAQRAEAAPRARPVGLRSLPHLLLLLPARGAPGAARA